MSVSPDLMESIISRLGSLERRQEKQASARLLSPPIGYPDIAPQTILGGVHGVNSRIAPGTVNGQDVQNRSLDYSKLASNTVSLLSTGAGTTGNYGGVTGGWQSITLPGAPAINTASDSQYLVMQANIIARITVINSILQMAIGLNGTVLYNIGFFHSPIAGGYMSYSCAIPWACAPLASYTLNLWFAGNAGSVFIDVCQCSLTELRR